MLGNDIFDYVRVIAPSISRQTRIKLEAVTMANNADGYNILPPTSTKLRDRKEDRDKQVGMVVRKGLRAHAEGWIRFNRKDRRGCDEVEGEGACLIGKYLGDMRSLYIHLRP